MKKILIVLFMIYSTTLWALPKHFEVWFLSSDTAVFLDDVLFQTKFSKNYAQQNLQCQQMGEFCFDPQIGLYKPGEKGKVESVDYAVTETLENYNELPTARSIDRELIDCDKNMFFDIFCGKAQVQKNADIKLHIWVDVSTTMKQVDGAMPNDMCKRQRFITAIENKCPLSQKLDVHVFNESKKQIDTLERVCQSYGLNEEERLMRQIEESTVDHLIVITDVFEASQRFISFIENSSVGSHRGVTSPFTTKDMLETQKKIISYCL